jgi:hypothetical protein
MENGHVTMGADSAGVGGYALTVRKDEKVFINGEFIICFTSSFRMGNLLRYSFKPPERKTTLSLAGKITKWFDKVEGSNKAKEQTDEEFMNTSFVDSIRNCFKAGGFGTGAGETGGTFIVGYHGKLYEIMSDFQVGIPAANYCAIGCGQDLCLGSLYSTEGKGTPEERIKTALQAAEQYSAGVRGPFVIKSL